MTQITNALLNLFNKSRIVFWYDAKNEFKQEFDELYLPAVEKVAVGNDQFGLKYRILREHPTQKYLLYFAGPQPEDKDNWLLDVQLAHTVFSADQAAIWLAELGLGPSFLPMITTHQEFFRNEHNRSMLKGRLTATDTQPIVMVKMLAILTRNEPYLDDIFGSMLTDLAVNRNERIESIRSCGLDEFLWKEAKRVYGYDSQEKGIEDLALKMFQSSYAAGVGGESMLNTDAFVFLKRWKDNVNTQSEFEILSERYSDALRIEEDLQHRDYASLLELDVFRKIEVKIITDLAGGLKDRTIQPQACRDVIRKRRSSHWYSRYEQFYAVLENASWFLEHYQNLSISINNFLDGIQKYTTTWFYLDQDYRKVIFHARKAGHQQVLEELVSQVENLYTNNYLLKVNDIWQEQIDRTDSWASLPVTLQSAFYRRYIQPFIEDDKKVYVVVSDALRYEIGDELCSAINREDRYEAQIEPMVSMLPSYTQLGMAALLPHQRLKIAEDGTGSAYVDDLPSSGTDNRDKILKRYMEHSAAIRAEDFMSLNSEQTREIVRDNHVIYIYHNHIDAVGDKKDSEERTFEAAEDSIRDLILIIKKLNAGNATNMIVTADHGFLYQNSAIDDSDFAGIQPTGDPILYQSRRFVIGKNMTVNTGLKSFSPAGLGLEGEIEIQIPKSINRLRLSGSGSRYVHGGAALQEIVIPVIKINKKRESDISQVEVDVIRSATNVISTSQFSVVLYQSEPVSEKRQPRKLRLAIYDLENRCISDKHEILFDSASDQSRDRENSVRFLLTRDADRVDNQNVFLKLEEKVANTEHYREYKKISYTIRRTFTTDFDF